MLTDAEIARSVTPRPITEIAAKLGYSEDETECYGKYKAKVPVTGGDRRGKLILVTAMNPTPLGEGKTTVSISLADGLKHIGKSVALALREPSLGPVFGIKGGACGGGYAQVVPMEDINLHFTGDFHAITSANNLLSALIDNHIHFDKIPRLKEVTWKRCMDMNDRALRVVEVGLGGKVNGVPRTDGFVITAASEIMAVLCMASDFADLRKRLGDIVVGYAEDGSEVTAGDIGAQEAMAILLREAAKPNLVQTLEGTPAFVHGGPFANIAHGCNSIMATTAALAHAVVLTPPSATLPPPVLDASLHTNPAKLQTMLSDAVETVKQALSECPSYDKLIPAVLQAPLSQLSQICHLTPGIPVHPMLAKPTKGVSEVLDRLQGRQFTCEFKYDGERAQVRDFRG